MGSGARAPGPAWSCQTNLVVADNMQLPFSTFASSFIAVCIQPSDFRDPPPTPTLCDERKLHGDAQRSIRPDQ